MTDDTNQQDPWWKEHTGLFLAGSVPLIAGVRLMGVAKGNTQTAWALLHELDTGTLVVALVVQALLVGAPFVAVAAYLFARVAGMTPGLPSATATDDDLDRSMGMTGAIAIGLVVWMFSTSWVVLAVVVAAMVVSYRLMGAAEPPRLKQPLRKRLPSDAARGLILSGLFAVLIAPLWLPLESLDMGKQSITAQVLRETDHEFVVFAPASAKVIRLEATDVERRRICESRTDLWSPLTRFLFRKGRYPDCP